MADIVPFLSSWGPTGLLGLAITLILFGKLWTNAAYQDKCREAEKWEKAYQLAVQSRDRAEEQNAELLEFAKATYSILDVMFSDTEHSRRSGGAHRVVPTSR